MAKCHWAVNGHIATNLVTVGSKVVEVVATVATAAGCVHPLECLCLPFLGL